MSNISGSVDLNSIPSSLIDHVEILQDGASAVYGSDAITGVVNIITVKNFDGAQANAYLGMFDNHYYGRSGWDGKTQNYNFTIGTTGSRSAVVMSASYNEQDPIWAGSRAQFENPEFTLGKIAGQVYTAKGVFILQGGKGDTQFGQATCNPTCVMSLINVPTDNPTLSNFKNRDPSVDNDLPWPSYFSIGNEEQSLYLAGHYDVSNNVTFTSMGEVTVRDSSEIVSPPGPTLIGAGGVALVHYQPFGVGANNPYNPFHKDLVASQSQFCPDGTLVSGPDAGDSCTPNLLLTLLTRNIAEGGPRNLTQHVTDYMFRMGLNGFFDALGSEWDWDAGSGYGRAYASNIWNHAYNEAALSEQLDAPGWAQCNGPGQVGKPAGDAVQVGGLYYPILIPGCVPMNFFGGYNQVTGQGSITPAMLAYSEYQDHDITSNTMRDFTTNITGNLFNLPAGPLAVALGAEYLENDDFDHPDVVRIEGSVDEAASTVTQGRQRTESEYVEINVPLLSNVVLAKSLNLDFANRWSQFKWAGGDEGSTQFGVSHNEHATTGRAQIRWQPTTDLLLRGSWAQGFRVPNLSELYSGQSASYAGAEDPCAPDDARGGWNPGTPLPVGCNGVVHNQPFNQIAQVTGGNPGLAPEHSISRSVGFVYNPSWIPGFDISADYYNIDLGAAIGGVSVQFILDQCYIQRNPVFCSRVTTDNGGATVTQVRAGTANTGEEYTRGVDVSVHYRLPSTSIGDFSIASNWTFVQSFVNVFSSTVSPTGWASSENVGLAGIAQRKSRTTITWALENWSAHWALQYIGPSFSGCSGLLINADKCTDPKSLYTLNGQQTRGRRRLGATVYNDVSATYHLDAINTSFTLGIRNLFNKQFPCSGSTRCGFSSSLGYRIPGQFFYASMGVKF